MKDKLIGKVIVKQKDFPKDIGGGLTGDVVIEKYGTEKDGYAAYASVEKTKVGKVVKKKVIDALVRLTGMPWQFDRDREIFSIFFNSEDYKLATNNEPDNRQKELDLNIKKTAVGISCEKYLKIKAKFEQIKDLLASQKDMVLEQMRKAKKNTLLVSGKTFVRKETPSKEELQVK